MWSGAEQGSLTNTGYHHPISEHQEAMKPIISGATHKFEIWWPCESTPHINPVTHNFFMSTGMLCEQNNIFLTLAFQGDSLQLWPVFLTLLSEWGWVVVASGLSYWRSGDLGCSFVVFIYSNSESAISRVSFLVRFVSVPHCEFLFLEMLLKVPAHVSLSCLSPSLILVPSPH